MRFVSTGGSAPAADLRTVLVEGLAPDGGLYLPERWPAPDGDFLARLRDASLVEVAERVTAPFLAEIPPADRRALIESALDFPIPLARLQPSVSVLELFHGPTLAFKDVGARFLARLLVYLLAGEDRPLTVLVATSGDTGSAVAQAFLGLPRTRVVILFPEGKVSPLQERQFTTLGENIEALAVDGTFDDCQRLVKAIFADEDLRRRLLLTSANSINFGRLLPQVIYYFHAAAQLPPGAPPPLFSVPSGNFGNLTAGLIAQRLGLATAGFVAATNANDVVPAYLETGRFEPRPSVPTLSNAMDVGDPSNFDRIQALYGSDRQALQRDLTGARFTDDETRAAIAQVAEQTGTILDPHTAVGYLALEQTLARRTEPASGIVLATAHPAKFRDGLKPVLGREIRLPNRLAACLERERRSKRVPAEVEAVREVVEGLER
ncbi:MAG: threonine synthase [Acidobacteriota bacterium]